MIEIDGSFGEGGGQIVRSSLTLSLATGHAVRIFRIRARRARPGLRRQHLTAVRAAADIGRADVHGAQVGSRELTFRPGAVRPGDYRFDIGTAGSVTLVLQTVLPVLLTADGPSSLLLAGGTHNPLAPPFDFIERAFLPLLRRMGPTLSSRLERRGFFPAGGGKARVEIAPVEELRPLELLRRGDVRSIRVQAIVANLPRHIAERESTVVGQRLRIDRKQLEIVEDDTSAGPGNVVLVEIEAEHVTELFAGFGERGVRAETVGRRVAQDAARYLEAGVPIGVHLADQLLVPLALGCGGSFVTQPVSEHFRTNAHVIRRFLDVEIDVTPRDDGNVRVDVHHSTKTP